MKQGVVYNTLERLARRLNEEQIPYAIVGGMALNLHDYERMTRDIDILMTPEAIDLFIKKCVGLGYAQAFAGARKSFRDTTTQTTIEVLITGEYPGDGKPKPVAFPDPSTAYTEVNGIRVITLEKLIELKLASGLSASHRLRDLADVQDLITTLRLPLDFADKLDPSVRAEYQRLWQAAQSAYDKNETDS